MDEKKDTKKHDNVDIKFEYAEPDKGSDCKATTSYKGVKLDGYGNSWFDAKHNLLNRCGQLKSLGDPPKDETVDLDA